MEIKKATTEDYKKVFNTPEGKLVLDDLVEMGTEEALFSDNKEYNSYFNIGKKCAIGFIIDKLNPSNGDL